MSNVKSRDARKVGNSIISGNSGEYAFLSPSKAGGWFIEGIVTKKGRKLETWTLKDGRKSLSKMTVFGSRLNDFMKRSTTVIRSRLT